MTFRVMAAAIYLVSAASVSAQTVITTPIIVKCSYTETYKRWSKGKVTKSEQENDVRFYKFTSRSIAVLSPGDDDWYIDTCEAGCTLSDNIFRKVWDDEIEDDMEGVTFKLREYGSWTISRADGSYRYETRQDDKSVNLNDGSKPFYFDAGDTGESRVRAGKCASTTDPLAGKKAF